MIFNRIKRNINNKGYTHNLQNAREIVLMEYGKIPTKPAMQELANSVIARADDRKDIAVFTDRNPNTEQAGIRFLQLKPKTQRLKPFREKSVCYPYGYGVFH